MPASMDNVGSLLRFFYLRDLSYVYTSASRTSVAGALYLALFHAWQPLVAAIGVLDAISCYSSAYAALQ